jgi:tetratricopeptide (TPR) repeat protein
VVSVISQKLVPRGREVSIGSPAPWLAAVAILVGVVMSFFVARSYISGESLWSAAIARFPNSVYALNELGMRELSRNQVNAASAHFLRALQIDPANVQTHRNLGAYFETIGEPDRAYGEYLVVLNARPQDIDARCGLARSLAAQGNRSAALQQYQIVLKYKPEDERALNDMAAVYIDLGRYADAIDCYQRAMKSAPRYIATHINLANLYFRIQRYNDAARELDDAAAIDPTNYVIYVNLGSMRGQLADRINDPAQKKQLIQASEVAFRQALYCNPDSAVAAYNLGNVLAYESRLSAADAGKMREAVFYFAKACQLDPENKEYRQRLEEARNSVAGH